MSDIIKELEKEQLRTDLPERQKTAACFQLKER